jgi:hypothetical protein
MNAIVFPSGEKAGSPAPPGAEAKSRDAPQAAGTE